MLNSKQTSKIKLATYPLLLPLAFLILVAINAGSCIQKNSGNQENSAGSEQSPAVSDSHDLKIDTTKATIEMPDGRTVYIIVDEQPTFPGGSAAMMFFLSTNIKYPVVAQENGIQGRVTCSFIVEANGEITNIQILKGVNPSLDKETIRVISEMPRWNPGKNKGVAVPVIFSLPVQFRLNI